MRITERLATARYLKDPRTPHFHYSVGIISRLPQPRGAIACPPVRPNSASSFPLGASFFFCILNVAAAMASRVISVALKQSTGWRTRNAEPECPLLNVLRDELGLPAKATASVHKCQDGRPFALKSSKLASAFRQAVRSHLARPVHFFGAYPCHTYSSARGRVCAFTPRSQCPAFFAKTNW